MKKIFFIFFISVKFFYGNDLQENDNFYDFLKDESAIATKSKLNIDYAPSIITILKAESLEKLGAKDLFEALAFIPGVDNNRAKYGEEDLNIRGIFNGYYGGKYKFLINNTPINQLLTHDIFPYLPIEQIKQIEVIRGPGSSLYGESAFSGVINVVTKKNENSIFFQKEFFGNGRIGNISGANIFIQKDDLKINILASQKKSDGDEIFSKSRLVENLLNHHYSLIDINYKNTNFTLINSSTRYGSFYGLGYSMVDYDGNENGTNKSTIASLTHQFNIKNNFYVNLIAYYANIKNVGKEIVIYPNDFQDYKMDMFYKEKQLSFNLDLHYNLKNHTILAGYYSKDTESKGNIRKLNYDPNTFQPIIGGDMTIVDNNKIKRVNRAIYIQDIYKVNNKFSLTFGVRDDKYTDIKDSITPKIAGVYEINRDNIIKAQFAKSFRTPSFNEKYTIFFPTSLINKNIKAEIIDTYEIAYILNKRDYSIKTNFFYSKLKDLLFFNLESRKYENSSNANSKGVEVEFIKDYRENLILNSNFSYTQIDYKNINITQIDNFMFNLALFIKPYSTESFSIWYKYLREDIKEYGVRNYNRVNLNFEKTLLVNGNTLKTKIGIKNLFDLKYRYFDFNNREILANGRSLWVGVSYEF